MRAIAPLVVVDRRRFLTRQIVFAYLRKVHFRLFPLHLFLQHLLKMRFNSTIYLYFTCYLYAETDFIISVLAEIVCKLIFTVIMDGLD